MWKVWLVDFPSVKPLNCLNVNFFIMYGMTICPKRILVKTVTASVRHAARSTNIQCRPVLTLCKWPGNNSSLAPSHARQLCKEAGHYFAQRSDPVMRRSPVVDSCHEGFEDCSSIMQRSFTAHFMSEPSIRNITDAPVFIQICLYYRSALFSFSQEFLRRWRYPVSPLPPIRCLHL